MVVLRWWKANCFSLLLFSFERMFLLNERVACQAHNNLVEQTFPGSTITELQAWKYWGASSVMKQAEVILPHSVRMLLRTGEPKARRKQHNAFGLSNVFPFCVNHYTSAALFFLLCSVLCSFDFQIPNDCNHTHCSFVLPHLCIYFRRQWNSNWFGGRDSCSSFEISANSAIGYNVHFKKMVKGCIHTADKQK